MPFTNRSLIQRHITGSMHKALAGLSNEEFALYEGMAADIVQEKTKLTTPSEPNTSPEWAWLHCAMGWLIEYHAANLVTYSQTDWQKVENRYKMALAKLQGKRATSTGTTSNEADVNFGSYEGRVRY